MANLINALSLAALAALLSAGCGSQLERSGSDGTVSGGKRRPAGRPMAGDGEDEPQFLEGELETVAGKKIQLERLRNKPLVLMFAQDSCRNCAQEAKALVESLSYPDKPPTRVTALTILVGAFQEDAAGWIERHKIPWPVVVADHLEDFLEETCGTKEVPCTVVQLPRKGIVLIETGEVTVKQITDLTGPWGKK